MIRAKKKRFKEDKGWWIATFHVFRYILRFKYLELSYIFFLFLGHPKELSDPNQCSREVPSNSQ